jgi:hypothetical protein
MTTDVKATPKFFKRSLPKEETMELREMPSHLTKDIYIFLREIDDSDNPSRIRITLTQQQARDFAASLIESADTIAARK